MSSRDKAMPAASGAGRAEGRVGRKAAARAPKGRTKTKAREYTKAIVMAVIMALFFRQFALQAFRIPSSSMEQTLLIGDFLFVNKFLYGAQIPFTDLRLPAVRSPQRGDIIVFKSPTDGRDFIKRCVAVAGDKVELRGKQLFINGVQQDEDYAQHTKDGLELPNRGPRDFMPEVTIQDGHIFMLGDNRDNSHDSRYWGPLSVDRVKGKAMFIYFSVDTSDGWYKPRPRFTRFFDIIR